MRCVFIAPTLNSIGMGNLSSEVFLSLKTNWVRPCLTAISESFLILSIEVSRFSLLLKVQSIVIDF